MLFSVEAPTLFILFISSHGDADGKILTDKTKLIKGKDTYESFTTESVFLALKKNPCLKDALKLVFFGVSFFIRNVNTSNLFVIQG